MRVEIKNHTVSARHGIGCCSLRYSKLQTERRLTAASKPLRPLLLPFDSENAMAPRHLKSHFLSTSSSSTSSTSSLSSSEASTKRCPSPSPSVSRTSSHSAAIMMLKHAASSAVRRSQSVGRRPAVTSRSYNSTDLNGNNCNKKRQRIIHCSEVALHFDEKLIHFILGRVVFLSV
ncbi:hypothetical protein V6N12_073317 [Hibiscus sabdariffa]|uniref:Uncharacterized protein n=1 Tax=Hibiscus sabdariffa TaxID=183260 RepID=A0ABR2AGH9_9ROSI